jgi:hypothetical protein
MSKGPVELSLPVVMGARIEDVGLFMAWLQILVAKVRYYTQFSGEFIVDCQDGHFFLMAFDKHPLQDFADQVDREVREIIGLCELSDWAAPKNENRP